MRGKHSTGRSRAPPSHTQGTLDSWGRIQHRRRHHFTTQIPKHRYDHHSTPLDYAKDAQHFGDTPTNINTNTTLRIIGGNIKGVQPANLPTKITTVATRLKRLQTGHIAIQETNSEWNKATLRDRHTDAYKKAFGTASFQYSTTDDEFDSNYKPGGTATGALGLWVHRMVGRGRDTTGCGRWSYITYGGKEQKRLTVISAYRVSKDPRKGTTTARKQQHAVMYKDEELRPYYVEPHKQTLIDLHQLIQGLTERGHEVILAIDANQEETENHVEQGHKQQGKTKRGFHYDGSHNGSLSCFINKTGLVNLTTHRHEGPVPNTYIKGKSQIDFLFGTSGVLESIEATGILNESVLDSDHCSLFVDLNIEKILGITEDEAAATAFRTLRLDDPRISTAYRKELHKQFTHHGVYRKVKTLQTNCDDGDWDIVDEMLYEATDKTIGEAMQRAALACTNKARKEPWTKSVSNATHLIRYWGARIKRKGLRSLDDPVLNYYRDNAGELVGTLDVPLHIDVCMKHGIDARKRLKDVIKDSKEQSKTFEEEVAAASVERRHPHLTEDNEMHAHEREDRILSEIKNRGNQKSRQKMHRKLAMQIKESVKPNSTKKSSLNHVLIPTEGDKDTWERVTGKVALETHLKERNVKQFSAAGATPFGYSELGKSLGNTGDSDMAEEILSGTLEHPAMGDEAIRAIVKQLKKHPAIKKILVPIVTLEDFKEAVRLVPEKTASSYSGRGVPHYKACAEKTTDPLADVLSAVHAAMMSIPLATGYCPTRWKHVIDVMLAKIPGISRTDKLRIIQLLEADLNQVLRIAFARNIARLAKENEGIISQHQYGRADSTCMTPVINKLLTIQLLLQKKTEGIVFDNDAKGCYDLIVSGISLATLRRIGFSKESVRLLGTLWAQLQHHVATGYGVSETTYSSMAERLLYGIGQGSCASPILWALLNQLLMTALGDKFECIILHSVDKQRTNKRPGDSFVDDTTTGVTNDDSTLEPTSYTKQQLTVTEEAMVILMEEIMQFFLDILQVTGGDLAFVKCVYFLVCFRWKHGKARLLSVDQQHRGINLTSKITRQTSGIKRKSPTDSHTTLGFHIMGNGEGTAQCEHMAQKAKKYAEAIKHSNIWRSESWAAYNSLYLPSVSYGAAATTLSMDDCERIQRPVVNAILPKMGIARSAPRAVVFGTKKYGGMGLAHLAAIQGQDRILYLLGHLRVGDTTGQLIRTTLEYAKLECGCKGNPLTKDYNKYSTGLINKNWITEIWKYLTETNAKIEIPDLWEPTPGREGDIPIMEIVYGSDEFTPAEVLEVNRCRIYTRTYFTSDVTDITGTRLTAEAVKGHRSIISDSSWAWPVQQRPNAWGAWKKLLSLISLEGRLDTVLGKYNRNGHRQYWAVYNNNSHTLLMKKGAEWTEHKKIGTRNRYQLVGTTVSVPRDYTHVVQTTTRCSYFEITAKQAVAEGTRAERTPADENTSTLPPYLERLKGDETALRDPTQDIILATDGSVLFGIGYHSWIMANKEGEPCIEGGGPDDGEPLLMTSFRSELGGIAGGLAAVGKYRRQGHNIRTVKVLCDNQSGIKRCQRGKTGSVFSATEGDYDLTAAIDWLVNKWCKGIDISFQWVKGHADDLDRITTLEEDLNILADAKCDEVRQSATGHKRSKGRCPTWEHEICSLVIKNLKVTSHWKTKLAEQLLDGKLRQYLMEKERWSTIEFEDVCWHEQERAIKRMSNTRRTAIAKISYNLTYTAEKGNVWYGEADRCKSCEMPHEDWRHVITCKSISSELARADSWNKVKKTMQKWDMSNDMWITIEKGLRHYCKHPTPRKEKQTIPETPFQSTQNTHRTHLRKAFRLQSKIGWENFMKGRISKQWITTMEHQYTNNGSKLITTEWATKLILALWDHLQRIWAFRNDTVHKFSSQTTKQYKIDEIKRTIANIKQRQNTQKHRMTRQQTRHFKININKLQFESQRCWANIAELYVIEMENRCDENEALQTYLRERSGIG